MSLLKHLKSIRMKLFIILTVVVVIIIVFLISLNNIVLETYYLYSKRNSLLDAYEYINNFYNNGLPNSDFELEFYKISLNNNFDMIVRTNDRKYSVFI